MAANMNVAVPPPQTEERYFISKDVPGMNYLLPADQKEKERLDLQHRIFVQVFDGKFIFVPCDFSRGLSILDAGVGSGAWLLEAVHKLPPSTKFLGIDISPRLFPNIEQEDRERIQFSITSVTELPEEWKNTFDLVNQRLMMGALSRSQWGVAISGIHRALKPGGWVQCCELGRMLGDGPLTRQLDEATKKLFAGKGLLRDSATEIPQFLKEMGFVNIQVEQKLLPLGKWGGQLGLDAQTNAVGFHAAVGPTIIKEGLADYAKTEAEFYAHLEKTRQEWDETPGTGFLATAIYARKPE